MSLVSLIQIEVAVLLWNLLILCRQLTFLAGFVMRAAMAVRKLFLLGLNMNTFMKITVILYKYQVC